MEHAFLPRWMLKTLAVLLMALIAVVIINQLHTMHGNPPTMNISAQGKITAVPDLAIIKIGVVTEGTNIVDVKNQNNQKINQLIDFIKLQDIDKKDIQTTDFYASPKYNYENGQSKMVGYQANQMVTVKVRDINKSKANLEKILEGAVNNGANQIQGVNFSFDNPEDFRKQAREIAIENAKQKAKELTGEANLHLGKIVNIIENGDSSNAYPVAMNFSAQKSVAPDIQLGTQEIVENITLVFEV